MAIRQSRVSALLDAKEAADSGKPGAAAALVELAKASTGREIGEAMDRSGQDTSSWSRIKG